MWGAGGGAAGQAQNWGFNAQQVATEQEKWAALAHQWIQMKSCGAGLEQTLQPPLPPPQAGVNNNGTSNNHSHHSHSHNDSMDQIGEAPMDLDDSVSAFQQNHLIQQPLPLLNVNHQSLYTPDLITQIPPNPVISFSSMAPASSLQLPTRPLEPHPMQHQQLFQPAKIPSLMEQPFHHIQPPLSATQQLGQRLLHPSYLDHARQPTPPHHSASPSQGKSNNRRKSKQHPQSEYSDPQTVTSFEADQQNNYGYSSETTNSEVFEGIPRRSLPPWIREGLEKVEQEKRRMEQKEREDELRKKKEAERREQRQGLGDSEGPESDEDNSRDGGYTQLQKGYEMPKPYIPETQQQTPLLSAMSKRGTNETQPVLGLELLEPNQKVLTFRRPKSPTMEELMEGMSEDDRVELAMTVVRRQLTMILLEVTTDEMRQVAKDCIARAKQKVSTVAAVQVRKTSALASLISGGPLGLGGYETDSGSEDDEHAASQDNKRKPDSGEESSDNDEDSEAELVEEIEKKRLNFELRENEFTTNRHDSVNPRSTKLKPPTPETPKQKELTELSKKSLMEPPPTEAASVPKSPLQAPTTTPRKSESPINDHSHGGGSIRRTSSASEHEPSGHKREHPKSPDRDRVREHGRRHRSRSRERKKDDHRRRKSQSRSNSKERRPRSKSKSRSRERDRNRKRKSKSTSRSKSRDRDHDRKNRKRTRSRSHSPSKDRDRKKKHSRRSKSRSRSDSSSSRRRHRERRRRSSSSSSSSRGNRRKHKRHDKEKDERKEKSSSKKKSLRSRSRSPSKSKTGTSSSHSHRSKKNRHSRSKSPAVSTSSRPT